MTAAISYNQLQTNLEATCHQVCHAHAPVLVERQGGENVVLLAQEDYLSLLENISFLKSSESLLENIWNNSDDADYDKL